MQDLFAYGTLMCEDILHEVTGFQLPAVPGTLKGYSRRPVRGEHYPALVPHEDGRVEGLVYRHVSPLAWERLDRFEGEMYARESVQVGLEDGTSLMTVTYVARPEYRGQLAHGDWDFGEFLRTGKVAFKRGYRGYGAL
jgi:gamma-glutamylcyclotransferase (GGCT)/AIG2-like uncharacterized protein YtfP